MQVRIYGKKQKEQQHVVTVPTTIRGCLQAAAGALSRQSSNASTFQRFKEDKEEKMKEEGDTAMKLLGTILILILILILALPPPPPPSLPASAYLQPCECRVDVQLQAGFNPSLGAIVIVTLRPGMPSAQSGFPPCHE